MIHVSDIVTLDQMIITPWRELRLNCMSMNAPPIDAASMLLEGCNVTEVPVSAETIAALIGVRLVHVTYPDWQSSLRINDNKASIWIDEGDAPYEQRFMIAHALGHLMMHETFNECCSVSYDDICEEMFNEDQANEFAENLLMPLPTLRSFIESNSVDVDSLGQVFRAPERLINTQLSRLMI